MDVSYDERVYTPRGAGWLAFSATMLVVSGVFKIFDALWAFKYDDEVSEEVQTVVFGTTSSRGAGSGWCRHRARPGRHRRGSAQWARWVGIVAAALAAMSFLPWIYTSRVDDPQRDARSW